MRASRQRGSGWQADRLGATMNIQPQADTVSTLMLLKSFGSKETDPKLVVHRFKVGGRLRDFWSAGQNEGAQVIIEPSPSRHYAAD